jgi:hypothetical protein
MDSDFSSYSLEILLQEPDRLKNSIDSLKNQFDQSMASNYDFFIKTCENASTITDDLESCAKTVSELSSDLSRSISLCGDICLLAQNTATANSRIAAALRHFSQIVVVMEVPQAMRTLLLLRSYGKEGALAASPHGDALALCEALDSFARQHPGIPALQAILEKAQRAKGDVADSLLSRFNDRMPIASAAGVVSLLRTAGLHTEHEIRLALVTGRRKRLHSKIGLLPKEPAEYYIDQFTRLYQKSLHKIPTLYQAVFHDQEEDVVLSMVMHTELQDYCNVIRSRLDEISEVSNAREAMKQVLLFVRSLAQLGFNFCPMVDAMFYTSKWARR